MMDAWKKIRLGDACKTNTDSYSPKEEWDFVNYLDTGNITDNRIDSIQHIDVNSEKLPSRARRKVKKDSIIYSTVRPNQRHFGIIKSQPENFLVSTGFAVIDTDGQVLDADFLYYLLTQSTLVEALHAIAEQSTSAYPSIKPSDIEDLEIEIPDLATQKKIAGILSSLDRKITQNTEVNENLAEQAQGVLYHFMDEHPYQLHPLSDIAVVIDCLHSKKPSTVENSTYQLIQLDNIRDDGFLDMSATKYMISQADYENWTRKCEIIEGDCVITNVGRIGAVSQAPYGTKAAMGRNMTCIRLKPSIKLQAYFITVLLSNHMRRQIQSNTDEGTIMGALNVKNIPKLMFPIFESSVMAELESVLFPLRKQIEYNNLQNQTLSQLRDSLLPKLMSGELDVSSIET